MNEKQPITGVWRKLQSQRTNPNNLQLRQAPNRCAQLTRPEKSSLKNMAMKLKLLCA